MSKLTPERIRELQQMPYDDYLQTPEWKRRRKGAVAYADTRCQLCNKEGEPLHVHHRTYDNRGAEMPQDLIVLCKACHAKFHDKGSSGLVRDMRAWSLGYRAATAKMIAGIIGPEAVAPAFNARDRHITSGQAHEYWGVSTGECKTVFGQGEATPLGGQWDGGKSLDRLCDYWKAAGFGPLMADNAKP